LSKRYRKPVPQERTPPPAPAPNREPLRRAATLVLYAVMLPPILVRGLGFLAPLGARALRLPAVWVVSFAHHLTVVLSGVPVAGAILLSSGIWLLVGRAAVLPLPSGLSRSLRVASLALIGLELGTVIGQTRTGVPSVTWGAALGVVDAMTYALLVLATARTVTDLGEPRGWPIARWVIAGYVAKALTAVALVWLGPLGDRGPAAMASNALSLLLWVWTCVLVGQVRVLLDPNAKKPAPARTR
jgi:hypothetical protein